MTFFNRLNFSRYVGVSNILILSLLALSGCSQSSEQAEKNWETTGVFSEEAEAFYLKRHADLVEAYSKGQFVATYDTEIRIGEDLVAKTLPRGEGRISSEGLARLTDYAALQNSDSFIIYMDGKVVAETYSDTTTPDSLINAKSLAKPLGVIAIGRAIKAGRIDGLDQPISDFITEWKGTEKADIKIRNILNMTSGLLPQDRAGGPEDILNRAYLHPHHDEVIIHEYPMPHKAGERYEYSNANSELVAVVISRATGMSYQAWLEKEVLAPLGAPGGLIWLNREGGVAHSGCCVKLTSETFLKLGVLILNKGQWDGKTFLPASYISEMTTPTDKNAFAGMGVYNGRTYKEYRGAVNPEKERDFTAARHSEPYLDKEILLFDGNANQVVYILPSHSAVIMRLGPRPKAETQWDNAFLPNAFIRSVEN